MFRPIQAVFKEEVNKGTVVAKHGPMGSYKA